MSTVTVRRTTSYIVEHDDREFEVSHQPIEGTEPTVEELPNGKVVIGYLADDNTAPHNPREDENLGHMICWHRRHSLGDKHEYKDSEALWADILGETYEKLAQQTDDELNKWLGKEVRVSDKLYTTQVNKAFAHLRELVQKKLQDLGYVILPLYLYDHSGITMATGPFSCPWDSGQVGYIYAGPEDVKRIGCKPELVKKALEAEVAEYDHYISGECYGVCVDVFNAIGEQIEDDACWGILGSEYAEEELASQVKCQVEEHGKEAE
jgi:hypothetical protein